MPAPQVLELHAGPLRLALRPDLGGCVAGFWHGDTPVLLSADPRSLTTAWPSGGFVLAPYSNRIGHRRFAWQGQQHILARNNRESEHALHGVAWCRPSNLLQAQDQEAELVYHHRPDADWPFAFSLYQRLALSAEGLRLQLRLVNTDARSQPAGLGWHPYFPRRVHSHLRAVVSSRWQAEPGSELPSRQLPQAMVQGAVAGLDLDHCFSGWSGVAHIQDECLSLTLRASLPCLVVYTPPQQGFFCVEPVSHVNNALNMADPLDLGVADLAPGQALLADFWLDVAPA
jgi:aldose 1-epimerase